MVIVGRIFDIVVISEKVAQIVLKKKMNDKVVPVAISVFGYWKDRALNEMKLKGKDKIKANVCVKVLVVVEPRKSQSSVALHACARLPSVSKDLHFLKYRLHV